MSNFMHTYLLEQQTPIIHFQYDQPGAALRATEVKPKLDQFIIRRLDGLERAKKEHPNFFLPRQDALDYKLRIEATTDNKPQLPHSMYLGNMGKTKSQQTRMVFSEKITLKITCFNSNLQSFIDSCICDFFASYNFGARQNKGFGSFLITEIEGKKQINNSDTVADALLSTYGANAVYKITSTDPNNVINTVEKAFDVITHYYKLLKSGYNPDFLRIDQTDGSVKSVNNNGYQKSQLTKYFLAKGINSEKAYLKQQKIAPSLNAKKISNDSSNAPRYIRALLGVGTSFSFLNGTSCYNSWNKKYQLGKETISIKAKRDVDFRFASPILFKIVKKTQCEYVIILTGTTLNTGILDKEFEFVNETSQSHPRGLLKTPGPKEVNERFVFDFLEYAYYSSPHQFIARVREADKDSGKQKWKDFNCSVMKYEKES